MAEYSLAHVGINVTDQEEAEQAAKLFHLLFGFEVEQAADSYFAGPVELIKAPYRGARGHIAIGTADVPAAKAELEAKGFAFEPSSAKYREDGILDSIYLKNGICGFAVHLVEKM